MALLDGVRIIEVFLKKMIYENFVEILETVRNREVPFVLFLPVENTVIVN